MRVHEIITPPYLVEAKTTGFIEDLLNKAKAKIVDSIMPPNGKLKKTVTTASKLRYDAATISKLLGGLAIPIFQYHENMKQLEAQRDQGRLSADDFKRRHDLEQGTVVAKIGAGLASTLAGPAIGLFSLLIGAFPIIGPFIGGIIRFFTPEIEMYLMYKLNTQEGRDLLGKLIGSTFIEGMGWMVPDSWDEFISVIMSAFNASKEEINDFINNKPTTPTTPADPTAPAQPNAAPTMPADPTAPAQPNAAAATPLAVPDADPASYKNTSDPNSTYTDERFKRNANGELDFK